MGTSWLNITTQIDLILTNQRVELGHNLQIIGLLVELGTELKKIATILQAMQAKETKMADILDTVLMDVAQANADLVALLQAAQPTGIPANDPRFQQAIDALTAMDAKIKGATPPTP